MPPFPLSRSALAAASLIVLAIPVSAQQPFEGVLTIRLTSPSGTQNATYSLKGERMRMDMAVREGMQLSMIVDRRANKAYLLMAQQRMYVEHDFDESELLSAAQGRKGEFTWTGKKEKVAGLECEHALVTDETGSRYDVCIARGTGFFARQQGAPIGHRGGEGASGWERHVEDGFPLKVQKAGDRTTVFEVTRIERKSLSGALFTPPSGWQKMRMPVMPGPRP